MDYKINKDLAEKIFARLPEKRCLDLREKLAATWGLDILSNKDTFLNKELHSRLCNVLKSLGELSLLNKLNKVQNVESYTWIKLGLIDGCYIATNSEIKQALPRNNVDTNKNVAYSIKYCRSMLTLSMLSQVYERGEWDIKIDWSDGMEWKYCPVWTGNKIERISYNTDRHFFPFKRKDDCDKFIRENEDLLKVFFMVED